MDITFLVSDSMLPPSEINVKINLQTLVTAVAVNSRILSPDNLVPATIEEEPFEFGGQNYVYTSCYYSRYPDMDPIWCAVPLDGNGKKIMFDGSPSFYDQFKNLSLPYFLCLTKWVSSHFTLPAITHAIPGCDECPPRETATMPPTDGDTVASQCSRFTFFASLIYFPT